MQIRWLGLFHKKGGCLENILLFLLISIYLPDNSPFRVANKINDVFYFGAGRHFCFNLCEGIRSVESALINDAVGIVDILYNLVRKTTTTESDDVDSTVSDRFASGYDIRRNIFTETASSLNHNVSAYPAKLVH